MEEAICNQKRLKVLRERKKADNDMVTRKRLEYRTKRDKAILNLEKVVSIIIDKADQSTFGLPYFISKTKAEREISIRE